MRANPCIWAHDHVDQTCVWRPTCDEGRSPNPRLPNANCFDFSGNSPGQSSFKYCPFCGGQIEQKEKLDA